MNARDAMTMDPETLITSGDVVALMGVSRQTVNTYVRDGRMRAHRLPSGVYRFRLGDVLPFLPPPADNRWPTVGASIAAAGSES